MAQWWETAPVKAQQPKQPNWWDAVPAKTRAYEPSAVPVLDQVNAAANSFVRNIPIAGPTLESWGNNVDAAFNNMLGFPEQTAEDRAQINQAEMQQFPTQAMAGGVAGTVLPLMMAPQALMGGSGSLMTRASVGTLSGYGLTFADALARGDSPDEAGSKALMGGAVGGAFPFAAKGAGMLWNGVKGALTGAASGGVNRALSQGVKDVAGDVFRASDGAGVTITKPAYDRFLAEISQDFTRLRANGALDPKAIGVLDELAKVSAELGKTGGLQLGDLHILRQIAQKAAQSGEGRDQMLNSLVIDKLDDFMGKLTPADIAGAADPTQAVQALQAGIENWHVAKKASIIEDAMYRAQNQASGYENGLRVQFRSILNNPRQRQAFTPEELAQIEQVVNGSLPANALRLVGRFGFSGGSNSNALGGAVGAFGGAALGDPTGGLATLLVTSGARAGAENLTGSAAERILSGVVGGPAPPTAKEAVFRALTNANQNPVNFPISPVAAALMLQ